MKSAVMDAKARADGLDMTSWQNHSMKKKEHLGSTKKKSFAATDAMKKRCLKMGLKLRKLSLLIEAAWDMSKPTDSCCQHQQATAKVCNFKFPRIR